MKRIISSILCLCLIALTSMPVFADEKPTKHASGDYQYIILEDDTAEIVKYSGDEQHLIIPDDLGWKKVTAIGESAFLKREKLKSVTIPDSITYIEGNPFVRCNALERIDISPDHSYLAVIDGVLFSKPDKRLITYPGALNAESYSIPNGIQMIAGWAFSDCDSLTSITIPDSVTTIADNAFYSCDGLTEITIPNGVISVGNNPFESCLALTQIIIAPDHPQFSSIDGVLFDKQNKSLLCYPCGFTAEEYQIPEGIETIGAEAFSSCRLSKVTIPDSVTSIAFSAFSYCYNLSEITIPGSVTDIGKDAFYWCDKLKSVKILDGVTSIGDWTFYMCKKLTDISIPDSVETIGENTFLYCDFYNLTATVGHDSYAKQYCIDNKIKYTYFDANDWLNN